MPRSHEVHNVLEKHYYKEVKRQVVVIDGSEEQAKIDAHIKKHKLPPDGTTREMGFSSFVIKDAGVGEVEINESMVKRRKVAVQGSTAVMVSRLKEAPKLPISCLADSYAVKICKP